MNKIFIGVDVSKGYADVQLRNEAGTFLSEEEVFDDTAAGHKRLLDLLSELQKKNGQVEFVVGLEASGGLERNWEKFFRTQKSNYNVEVLVLHPLAVRKYLERNLRRNKTDKISARNIAEYLAAGRRRQDLEYEPELAGARTLYHCITAAIGRRVQGQCQLQSLLPAVQPELVQYCRDGLPQWILELLVAYPTANRLAKAKAKTVAKINQISLEKASRLIAAAQESVASLSDEYIAESIVFLSKDIRQQNGKIAEVQHLLSDSMKDHPDVKIIESLKGIGTWTAVILRLEYGSLERFHSADAAVAYAGLDPRIDQSGDMVRNIGISRAGRAGIRTALYMPTLAAIRWNPVIREFYRRLIAAGKKEKVAIVACMRKLIHIIYACVITGNAFDPNYQQQHAKPVQPSTGLLPSNKIVASRRNATNTAAPVSRKEARKRKVAAAMPQKDQKSSNAWSKAAANKRINESTLKSIDI